MNIYKKHEENEYLKLMENFIYFHESFSMFLLRKNYNFTRY